MSMWINIGKQAINLDQVARIEVAKSYVYLYAKDPGAARSAVETAPILASIRCNSEAEAQERFDRVVKLIGAVEA